MALWENKVHSSSMNSRMWVLTLIYRTCFKTALRINTLLNLIFPHFYILGSRTNILVLAIQWLCQINLFFFFPLRSWIDSQIHFIWTLFWLNCKFVNVGNYTMFCNNSNLIFLLFSMKTYSFSFNILFNVSECQLHLLWNVN